jgi:hypothetical protein
LVAVGGDDVFFLLCGGEVWVVHDVPPGNVAEDVVEEGVESIDDRAVLCCASSCGEAVQDGHAHRHEQLGAGCRVALEELFGCVERAAFDAEGVEVDEEALVGELAGEVCEERLAPAQDGGRDAGIREAFDGSG